MTKLFEVSGEIFSAYIEDNNLKYDKGFYCMDIRRYVNDKGEVMAESRSSSYNSHHHYLIADERYENNETTAFLSGKLESYSFLILDISKDDINTSGKI